MTGFMVSLSEIESENRSEMKMNIQNIKIKFLGNTFAKLL